MKKAFKIPKVKNTSDNEPIYLITPAQILGFYNQENPKTGAMRVTAKIKKWYIEQAIKSGWPVGTITGNQIILSHKELGRNL